MTVKKLIIFTLLQWLLLFFLKLVFFNVLSPDSPVFQLLFMLLCGVITAAMARRLGVINYLESMFIAGLWFIMDIVLDLVITANITGFSIFGHWQLWGGYLALIFSAFMFHKKRHIEIRKEQLAHHHHGHDKKHH